MNVNTTHITINDLKYIADDVHTRENFKEITATNSSTTVDLKTVILNSMCNNGVEINNDVEVIVITDRYSDFTDLFSTDINGVIEDLCDKLDDVSVQRLVMFVCLKHVDEVDQSCPQSQLKFRLIKMDSVRELLINNEKRYSELDPYIRNALTISQ